MNRVTAVILKQERRMRKRGRRTKTTSCQRSMVAMSGD